MCTLTLGCNFGVYFVEHYSMVVSEIVLWFMWAALYDIVIKACAHYFLSKFYFSPNDSPLKTTKNVISSKKLFSFSRHSSFSIFVFPSFCPCQPLLQRLIQDWYKVDTNLIVYDVINCLNKNIITHFVWYLEKEKRYDIETLSIDRVLNKEHFYGKIMQKMCTKS